MSFTLRSLHFTFIDVHICYLYTPTFSSKSLICLLWISVLSSRSRILCKNSKKWSVFFFSPYKEAEWASGCILQGLPGEPGAAVPSSPGGSGSRTRDSSSASASSASPPPSAAHPSASHPEVRHILSPEGRVFYLTSVEWYFFYTHFPDGLINSDYFKQKELKQAKAAITLSCCSALYKVASNSWICCQR